MLDLNEWMFFSYIYMTEGLKGHIMVIDDQIYFFYNLTKRKTLQII